MDEKEPKMLVPEPVSPRRFIGLGAAALDLPFISRLPAAAFSELLPPDRSLSFYNTHTREWQAVDIRVPGLKLQDLYRAAASLRGGGVGMYPESDFVHVDIGRVLTW